MATEEYQPRATRGVVEEDGVVTEEYQPRATRGVAVTEALKLEEGETEAEEYESPNPRATSEVAEAVGVATEGVPEAEEYQPRA